MSTPRQILFAVKDPRSRSLASLNKAAQLARAFGARLELFHAISTPLLSDAYGFKGYRLTDIEDRLRGRRLRDLQALAAPLRRYGINTSVAAEWDFPPFEAIVRRACRIKADLIVAEQHAGRHFAARLLHLTDWELLRLSPMPVLLIKDEQPYDRPVVLAAVDPAHRFGKTSGLDRDIILTGAALSKLLDGSLHAVHAYVREPLGTLPADVMNAELANRIETDAIKRAEQGFARLVQSAGIPAARRHLVEENASDAIVQTARDIKCNIVVMGAVARAGLRRVFIGNTAERVLDRLECDVLVIKPARFLNKVDRAKRGARLITVGQLGPLAG